MRESVLAGCALLVAACPAFSATIHVSPDGSGDYPTIQAAIDAASSGDEIVLSDGVFTGTGNWDLDFGTKELALRSANGREATTIDCGFDNFHDIFHQGLVLAGGQTSATKVEGITFEHSAGPKDGGSIRCVGASPVLRNLRFQANRVWGRGGDVFVQAGAPTIEQCEFQGNFASPGDGTAIYGLQSSPSVQACLFTLQGWGVVNLDGGTLVDCVFDGVQGEDYDQGAGLIAREGHLSLLRCTFRHIFGSSIWLQPLSEALIGTCLFEDNVGDFGPGIETQGNATIRSSTFRRNQAGFAGSAVESGGTLLMDHCVLIDNAAWGYSRNNGAVVVGAGMGTLSHCTFVGSRGKLRGSSIEVAAGADLAVDHTIIAFGGDAGSSDGAVYCAGTPGSLSVACTDIFGNQAGDWTGCLAGMNGTNGNTSADPDFCNIATGDLSLQANSPCAPANSGQCGLIGALGPWCGPLAVEPRSWGSIKALYR